MSAYSARLHRLYASPGEVRGGFFSLGDWDRGDIYRLRSVPARGLSYGSLTTAYMWSYTSILHLRPDFIGAIFHPRLDENNY